MWRRFATFFISFPAKKTASFFSYSSSWWWRRSTAKQQQKTFVFYEYSSGWDWRKSPLTSPSAAKRLSKRPILSLSLSFPPPPLLSLLVLLFIESCRKCMLESKGRFHQRSMYNFYARSSPKRKNSSQVVSIFLRFWDLRS